MYRSPIKPYPHQTRALKALEGQRTFALLMAMRTGKTKVLLDDFGRLEDDNQVKDHLVIAPAGVYRTWEGAIREHTAPELLGRSIIHTFSAHSRKRDALSLQNFLNRAHDKKIVRTLLMNVEALSSVEDARKLCEYFISQRSSKILGTIDESTIIKNKSKRTKYINTKLAPSFPFKRILSGLVTPRSPLDLFYQFEFLDWKILGFRSFVNFRARYSIMQTIPVGGRQIPIVVGYRDVEELQEAIAPYSFRVPFRPKIPSTYSIYEVEMTKEQKRLYEEMKEFATTKLKKESHVTATIVISQLIRLHQILCGHVKDENGVEHIIPENKTKCLLELLEEYQGKAIIWCSYDHDIQKVTKALEKEYGAGSVSRFWGGNSNTREEEEARFKSNPKTRFQVATPSAGGRGRTWDIADLVIYYSSTNNLEHRDQSEQRVQGVKKDRQVDYVDLICPGTVETKFLHALRNKINLASIINGDNYRDWIV